MFSETKTLGDELTVPPSIHLIFHSTVGLFVHLFVHPSILSFVHPSVRPLGTLQSSSFSLGMERNELVSRSEQDFVHLFGYVMNS